MSTPSYRRPFFAFLALIATPILVVAHSNRGGDERIGSDAPPITGQECGKSVCQDGEFCCNASCGICAPEGGACILIACAPDEVPCGDKTCPAGSSCCDPAC